jgi:hypothetical protein
MRGQVGGEEEVEFEVKTLRNEDSELHRLLAKEFWTGGSRAPSRFWAGSRTTTPQLKQEQQERAGLRRLCTFDFEVGGVDDVARLCCSRRQVKICGHL